MKRLQFIAFLAVATLGASFMHAADGKAPEELPASYPLNKCVISGESLGEMGKPFKVTHDGTDVYLCCKSCLKDFNKEPGKHVKAVKDAAAKK